MKKKYLFRIIFWSIILVFSIFLGVIGLINSNKEFNNNKKVLNEIIRDFNNHSTIKEFGAVNTKINASLKNKKIVINYNDIKKYKFNVKDNYLEITINKDDSDAKMIIMILADSIAIYKGQEEKSTFEYFITDKALLFNFEQGISYTLKNNKYVVKLNLNRYVKE